MDGIFWTAKEKLCYNEERVFHPDTDPHVTYRVLMRSPTHLRVSGACTHYAAGSGGEERTVSTITGLGCDVFTKKFSGCCC